MRRVIALLVLVAVVTALLVQLRGGGDEQPLTPAQVVAGEAEPVGAAVEAESGGAEQDEVARPESEAGRAQLDLTGLDLPGTRISGRLLMGDTVLADAAIEIWRKTGLWEAERVAELSSDAAGRFTLDGLAAGEYMLVVVDERAPMGAVAAQQTLQADDAVDLGDLVVRRPGRITARIIDEVGRRMEGVRAVLRHGEWQYRAREVIRYGMAGNEPGQPPERRSDAEGLVVWDRVPPGEVELGFRSSESIGRLRRVELAEGGEHDLGEITLARGRRLEGRVIDWAGEPVADARVREEGHWSEVVPVGEARTDAEGRFVLAGLRSSGPKLTIEAEGQVPIEVTGYAFDRVAEFQLPRGFWVTGRVRGAPAEAVRLKLDSPLGEGGAPISPARHIAYRDHSINDDGSFRLGPLIAARWELWVEAGAHGTSPRAEFTIEDADLELDIEVGAGDRLEVLVRDAAGRPVEGVKVAWADDVGYLVRMLKPGQTPPVAPVLHRAEREGTQLVTDAEGIARVPLTAEEMFMIAVVPEGGIAQARAFLERPWPKSLEFQLSATGGIRGRLRGLPELRTATLQLSARRIATEGEAGGAGQSSLLADGSFVFEALEPGQYEIRLSARAQDFDPKATVQLGGWNGVLGQSLPEPVATGIEVIADQITDCEIDVPALGRVSGVVRWRGQPIEGCQVVALRERESGAELSRFLRGGPPGPRVDDDDPPIGSEVSISGEDGGFRFDVLEAGDWQIYLRHPRGIVASGPWPVGVIGPGDEVVMDLRLGGARIDLWIDPEWFAGWANERSQVFLFRAEQAVDDGFDGEGEKLSYTAYMSAAGFDSSGLARIDFVPAGAYVLRIGERYGRTWYQQGLVAAVDDTIQIGPLSEPAAVTIDVAVATPEPPAAPAEADAYFRTEKWLGVALREYFDGIDTPAFATRARIRDGRFQIDKLRPGRYQVRLELVTFWSGMHGSHGYEAKDGIAELTVHADGTTSPDSLDLR